MSSAGAELGCAIGSLTELADLLRRDGSIGERLVLLEEIPRSELSAALDRWRDRLILRHPSAVEPLLARAGPIRIPRAVAPAVLLREHAIFPASVEQLRWLLDLTARDGHGGNRQALGQSWKLLVEAVARHLADERSYLERLGPMEM